LHERIQFGPKLQVQGVVPHQPFFLSENYMNGFLFSIRTLAIDYFVSSQCTRLTDRQTNRQKGDSNRALHSQSHGKTWLFNTWTNILLCLK